MKNDPREGKAEVSSIKVEDRRWRIERFDLRSSIFDPRSSTFVLRILAFALTGVLLVSLGWRIVSAARHGMAARADLEHLQTLAGHTNGDQLTQAVGLVADLRYQTTSLEQDSQPFWPLLHALGWLPGYGGTVAAAPALIQMGASLSVAADEMATVFSPLLQSDGSDAMLFERATQALESAQIHIGTAQAAMADAQTARAQIDERALRPSIAHLLERADAYLPAGRAALNLVVLAPTLLGSDQPRTYLLLAQNSEELRATGGFISGLGVVHVTQGKLASLRFSDSYAVDNFSKPHPSPPPAVTRTMGADLLTVRDSNWSPDFPTTAQTAASMFELETGERVDGVIAIDLAGVVKLIGAVGPLQIDDNSPPVTADNALDLMKARWAQPDAGPKLEGGGSTAWYLQRKDFMGEIVKAALTRIQSGGIRSQLPQLVQATQEILAGKHLLIALSDAKATALLAQQNWDGALHPGNGDYLMVVDANVGFNKVNPRIIESVDYKVARTKAGLQATVTLSYTHTGQTPITNCIHEVRYQDTYAEMAERCYWDYVRVYAPAGSQLQQMEGVDPDVREAGSGERGLTVMGGEFVLQPGATHQVRLVYLLPPALAQRPSYELRIQNQPGRVAIKLSVHPGQGPVETRLLDSDLDLILPNP